MVTVLPEKFEEIKEAISFETVDNAYEILQEYVDGGTIVDYAISSGYGIAVKFKDGEEFWLMTSPAL